MQENNEQAKNKPSESSSKKSKKENKQGNFFKNHKAEFKKITWPSRKILAKQTGTVIVVSLVVGAIIFVYDFGIDFLFDTLTKLMA